MGILSPPSQGIFCTTNYGDHYYAYDDREDCSEHDNCSGYDDRCKDLSDYEDVFSDYDEIIRKMITSIIQFTAYGLRRFREVLKPNLLILMLTFIIMVFETSDVDRILPIFKFCELSKRA
jgi:hypothetical protein